MERSEARDAVLVQCRDLTRDVGALAQALRQAHTAAAGHFKATGTGKPAANGFKRQLLFCLELLEESHALTEQLFEQRAEGQLEPSDQAQRQHAEHAAQYAELSQWAAAQPEAAGLALRAEQPAPEQIEGPAELQRVVEWLHQRERTIDFQMGLVAEAKAAEAASGYSRENFSYGTTPYSSWRQLAELPCVAQAAERARRQGRCYTVFGSSAGWLAFYGALTLELPTVGVELMAFLVQEARAAAEQCGLAERVRFEHGDMLAHDLAECELLMLTSQCWDRSLIERLGTKLADQMAPGAVVIDYRKELGAAHPDQFELAGNIQLPVSWNDRCQFYIFQHK